MRRLVMLTREQAETLATWAQLTRGWDRAGCLKMLGRVKTGDPHNIAMAWIRFCADNNARTPGAFPNQAGPHWTERVTTPAVRHPPRAHSDEECPDHIGEYADACRICHAPRAAHDHHNDNEPITTTIEKTDALAIARAQIADARHPPPTPDPEPDETQSESR